MITRSTCIICNRNYNFLEVKTAKDLYEALYPAEDNFSYENFLGYYKLAQDSLAFYGGYTNIPM